MDNTEIINDEPTVLADVEALFTEYLRRGPAEEYKAFERVLHNRNQTSVWQFIYDAVHSTGGFADGSYLFASTLEVENGVVSTKLKERAKQADYDPFAAKVCNTAWDQIVSVKDLIRRTSSDTRVDDFWSNVDRSGSGMLEFLEYPFRQARMYGTGWVFVDRPAVTLRSKADEQRSEHAPYLYSVPTQNVVYWSFDEDNVLTGVVVVEPRNVEDKRHPVRVWTQTAWAVFSPNRDDETYALTEWGENPIDEIPAVMLWNDAPEPGKALGHSEMLAVAKLAQTVYEVDSEIREQERKANSILFIPVDDSKSFEDKRVVVGVDKAVTYDGKAGRPEWASADLQILEKLETRRRQKIESAYDAANLAAFYTDVTNATSGIHAEYIVAGTEQRIARHADQLESAEMKILRLVLKFLGTSVEEAEASVVYPRKFGIYDPSKLLDRTERELKIAKGERFKRAALREYFQHRFPRLPDPEIDLMVDEELSAVEPQEAPQTAGDRVSRLLTKAPVRKPKADIEAPQNAPEKV